MKNTLTDLNDHLFAQLERLNDESLKGDKLKQEIERSKAMSNTAAKIIDNASLVLEAQRYTETERPQMANAHPMPAMLENKKPSLKAVN